MGKKKQFIDKKKAVSFRLVHRSQRDPLQADDESSQHVLLPVHNLAEDRECDKLTQASGVAKDTVEDRKNEQQKHGVFFEDEYDYLQHLKQRTDTHLEPLPSNITVVEAKPVDKKKFGNFTLPSEAFASKYEEDEGLLNLAAPISGPRPDWDPDIVAALDDALDLDDPKNLLEDDFIIMASGEQHDGEMGEDNDGEMDEDGYFPSDEDNFGDDSDDDFDKDDSKSRLSNYSMTSSVIRRTQGLCLLDDRFDKIMEEYEDDEIGALDHEEVGGQKNLNDPLLESIKNEIIHDVEEKTSESSATLTQTRVSFNLKDDEKSNDDDDDNDFIRIAENPKEQWDCESILSTYSNLYNHPTVIKESSNATKTIPLSKKNGIPLGVLSDGNQVTRDVEDTQPSRVNHARCRGETKDEKKARKQMVKQERQTRRAEKKTNKLLFKEEWKRQEKTNSGLLVGQKIQ